MKRAMRSQQSLNCLKNTGKRVDSYNRSNEDADGNGRKDMPKACRLCAGTEGNQTVLYEDVKLYFSVGKVKEDIRGKKNYNCTTEKAHGQIEKREYYQTEDIGWLGQKKEWKGIKSIGIE